MKKVFLFVVLAIFAICLFPSCNQQSKTTTIVTTTTTIVPTEPTNGFYIKTKVVVRGNTVWGISQKVYGSGFKWRDIIAQNPFLNAPGRVYYDQTKKMWMVLIYPGEVLKIGGEVVNPTYVVEEKTTTTTTTEKPEAWLVSVNQWWAPLLIFLGFLAFIVLIVYVILDMRNRNNSNNPSATSNSNSSSAIHVNIRDNAGIDLATRTTLLARQQDLDDRAVAIAEKSEAKNQLSKFDYSRTETGLSVKSEFFPHSGNIPATEPASAKPAEQSEEGK